MKNKNKHPKKNPPNNFNPIAKYGPRLNKPKIIPMKKPKGPQREEWDS